MTASTHTRASSGGARVSAELASPVQFGREICGSLSQAREREWLVANGIGGFASETISDGHDSSLRPNQILAVSLPESLLTNAQQRAVVDACAYHLLTSFGLRSLAPEHSDYRGVYGGRPRERDGAYHQGTVWGWLLGPFVQAHLKVFGDPAWAASFLQPIADPSEPMVWAVPAKFSTETPPFPRGCIAQAWTVSELLRAWTAVISAADAVASNVQDKLAKNVVESFKEEPVASARKIRMQSYQDGLE